MPLVYEELRRLAHSYMRKERSDHTLQATVLVHEAYMRLIEQREMNWANRAHFFGVAAHLMRLILIDHARRHRTEKRGSGQRAVQIERVALFAEEQYDDLIALDAALNSLAAVDERMAKVVELRFFTELSVEETAEVLGVSPKTVKRDWRFARVWLARQLREPRSASV